MEWVRVRTSFDSEAKAQKAAGIVATTEARLAGKPRGPQYEIEIKVEQSEGRWHVFWRKLFVGNKAGCGAGCGSCADKAPKLPKAAAKVIPFKRNADKDK